MKTTLLKHSQTVIKFNPRIVNLKPSPTLEINEKSKILQKQGRKIYKLGFGQSPFPVPNIMVEELKKYSKEKDYLPVQGLFPLREAISNYYSKKFEPQNILIGPGSKEVLEFYILTQVNVYLAINSRL
jgi:aspartate aminotransferase